MSYFTALGLQEEPFSNSPSPDFFFRVPGRVEVLNLLEVSVRLRRGLNVVLGEVGTGKTTLCRQLIRNLGEDDVFVTFLLLDPYFSSPLEFLRVLYGMVFKRSAPLDMSEWQLKEEVKAELVHRAVERNQIVTLIIDEGQKIQDDCLELLREFLNFETNENKLLQIVIFAQNEFDDSLQRFPNLVDRVDSLHRLKPMSLLEMRDMIRYRLQHANGGEKAPELFTMGAYLAIHRITRGYPRKVVALCHKTMLALLMLGRAKATMAIVYKASGRSVPHVRWGAAGAVCAGCVAAAFIYVTPPAPQNDALEQPDAVLTSPAPQGALASHEAKARAMELASGRQPEAESEAVDAGPPLQEAAPDDKGAGKTVVASGEKGASEVQAGIDAEADEEWEPLVKEPLAEAPEATAEVAAQAPAASAGQVDVLGVMPLGKGELLSRAISKVYGVYRTAYLEKLLEANPHIQDPDRVAAGTAITYPPLVSAASADVGEGFWLRLASYDTLEQAAAALESAAFKGHEVRLLPVADAGGTHFHIVAAKRYRKETQARAALDVFPEALREQAVVVRHWQPEAVLYTDRTVWGEALAKR